MWFRGRLWDLSNSYFHEKHQTNNYNFTQNVVPPQTFTTQNRFVAWHTMALKRHAVWWPCKSRTIFRLSWNIADNVTLNREAMKLGNKQICQNSLAFSHELSGSAVCMLIMTIAFMCVTVCWTQWPTGLGRHLSYFDVNENKSLNEKLNLPKCVPKCTIFIHIKNKKNGVYCHSTIGYCITTRLYHFTMDHCWVISCVYI